MRNKEYKDDQRVFTFINSDRCKTLGCLYDFLKENKLPVRERWVFYLLGKFDYLDEESIFSMSDKELFGGYYSGEVFYWSIYLKKEEEKRNEIGEEILLKNNEYLNRIKEIEEEIEKLEQPIKVLNNCPEEAQFNSYSDEGLIISNILKIEELMLEYKSIKNLILNDENFKLEVQRRFIEDGYCFVDSSFEDYYSMLERLAFLEYKDEEIVNRNPQPYFCEACQESPCRCSDPDPN